MKTALIWGAAGGIGRALISHLNSAGWRTIGIARDPDQLKGAAHYAFGADISKAWEVEKAVYEAAMEVDSVDLWVYAAGDIASEKIAKLTPDDWQRILDANLTGAYLTAHQSLPLLADNAHMVFLGAVSERLRLPGLAAYAAAKAGLEAFVEALAKEERRKRITIVRPGAVNTPLWDKVRMRLPADAPHPEKVAGKILEAYTNGHKGRLDLV